MKYTVQTSKYISKNLLYILPFAILPAFFLSMSVAKEEIAKVINAVFAGDFEAWTFSDLFCAISVLNFSSWQSVVMGLIGVIVIVPCVSLMMAFMDKHMRFGKRTFNGLLPKLNDNFISTLGYTVLFLIIYEVWALITSALLFLVSLIPNAIAVYIVAPLIFIVMHVVLLYAIGAIYLWLPCMQITGFPTMEALQYSYHLLTPVKWGILGGQIFALLATEGLIVLCAMYLPNFILFTIWSTVLFTVLLLFYCVRMMITYFDRDQIERADLRKYY